MKLRNGLVHFVPETLDQDSQHRLEQGLRDRIEQNRQNIGVPWYPNRALGAGCARWAHKAATALVDQWQRRMGFAHDYHGHLDGMEQP